MELRVSEGVIEARVGEWVRGIRRTCEGALRPGYVVERVRGPLAVVR